MRRATAVILVLGLAGCTGTAEEAATTAAPSTTTTAPTTTTSSSSTTSTVPPTTTTTTVPAHWCWGQEGAPLGLLTSDGYTALVSGVLESIDQVEVQVLGEPTEVYLGTFDFGGGVTGRLQLGSADDGGGVVLLSGMALALDPEPCVPRAGSGVRVSMTGRELVEGTDDGSFDGMVVGETYPMELAVVAQYGWLLVGGDSNPMVERCAEDPDGCLVTADDLAPEGCPSLGDSASLCVEDVERSLRTTPVNHRLLAAMSGEEADTDGIGAVGRMFIPNRDLVFAPGTTTTEAASTISDPDVPGSCLVLPEEHCQQAVLAKVNGAWCIAFTVPRDTKIFAPEDAEAQASGFVVGGGPCVELVFADGWGMRLSFNPTALSPYRDYRRGWVAQGEVVGLPTPAPLTEPVEPAGDFNLGVCWFPSYRFSGDDAAYIARLNQFFALFGYPLPY